MSLSTVKNICLENRTVGLAKYACLICEHDFKSRANLIRHQEKKKKCTKNNIPNQQNNNESTNIKDDNESKDNVNTKFLLDIINKEKERNSTIVMDLFKEQLTLDGNFRNQLTSDDNFKALLLSLFNDADEREKEKQLALENKNICDQCGKEFKHYQSLDRHKRLGRCKPVLQQNTNNTIVNQTVHITNNINLSNANIQLIVNVNPIGCEKLDHISVNDFKSIFTNIDTILDKLCYHIFNRHIPNISFYKNNLNKQLVSYLNMNMEIKKTDETAFIVYLKNILQDLCIQLFFIFKDQIPRKELLKYMQNLVEHQTQLYNEESFDKKFKSRITALLDDAFRKKDIRIAIENLVENINQNINQKNQLVTINKAHITNKNKIINEYYSSKKNSTEDQTNGLSLVKLKNEAIELNKQLDKDMLVKSQEVLKDALANITFN